MKQTKHILATLALLLCSLTASAHDFEKGGIYYRLTSSTSLTVAVSFRGTNSDSYSNEYSGTVIIPSAVTFGGKTYSVTSIERYAFEGCSSLTSITIPESVTSIGSGAFYCCSRLTSITIPASVTSIENSAFYGCTALKEVIIEDGSTTLSLGYNSYNTGEGLFSDCPLETIYLGRNLSYSSYIPFYNKTELISLTIGKNVTSIGDYAFRECSSLTAITIPEGSQLTSIGRYAFYNCSSLTSIIIPEGVTSIGQHAFYGCSSLNTIINFSDLNISAGSDGYGYLGYYASKVVNSDNRIDDCCFKTIDGVHYLVLYIGNDIKLTLPKDYQGENYKIGDYAFEDCSLTSITLPESVTSIGNYAFRYCSSLTSITIPEGVTSIGNYAFDGCSSLTSITIPAGVTGIGDEAFYGCSSLTAITIPESVTSIGSSAFDGCTGELVVNCNIPSASSYYNGTFYDSKFTKVTIGDKVPSIGNNAFYGCSSLTTVTISEGVTSIGERAFYGCSSLTSITIPDGVTSIGNCAFEGCTGELVVNSNIPSASSSDNGTFYNSKFTKVTIGDKVTSIGNYAFEGCSSLTTVTFPENSQLTSIGYYAFEGCSSLITVTFPENSQLTSIGSFAFEGCSSLTTVTFPENSQLTSIGGSAFEDCRNLTAITIPKSVTSIGEHAFRNCSNLTAVHISDIAAWCNIKFSDYDSNPLYNAHNLYLNGELVTELTIPEGVTSIGEHAFQYCSSLTAITISEGVTSIGEWAFRDCSSLKSITIPESVTSIGDLAFYDCTGELVVNCNIPSASAHYYGAFYNSKFTKVTIGDKVTSIGKYAFDGCSSLTSIILPESVTSIGRSAFHSCSSLTSITIPEGVTSIGEYAFSDCSSLTSITIPASVTSIGYGAFEGCSSLTTIVLPATLVSIGNRSFGDCSELLHVYCYAVSVPEIFTDTFDGSYPEKAILHVPSSSCASYRTTVPWDSFGKVVALGAPVTDITLSQSSATLYEGESLKLSISVTPSNADMNLISWSSSKPNVVTIDKTGKVTAVAPGTTTIIVTANDGSGVKASCEVVVRERTYGGVFMVDGDIYHINSLEEYTYPLAPEKDGFTFVKWEKMNNPELTEIDIKNNADAMLYSNAPCTNTWYGDQFVGWHVLFDGNVNTFFHSEYSEKESADGLDHYLRVDMGEGKCVRRFTFTYTVRGNDASYTPTRIVVEGSNEANGVYSEIEVLTDLPREKGAVYESSILSNGTSYRYIRYRITETVGNSKVNNHPYFYFAEFGMKQIDDVCYRAVYVPNGDEDGIITIPSQPVLISTQGGTITFTGLADGTDVAVYTTAGTQLGTATAVSGTATITTSLTTGNTAIVKIGNSSIKVVVK